MLCVSGMISEANWSDIIIIIFSFATSVMKSKHLSIPSNVLISLNTPSSSIMELRNRLLFVGSISESNHTRIKFCILRDFVCWFIFIVSIVEWNRKKKNFFPVRDRERNWKKTKFLWLIHFYFVHKIQFKRWEEKNICFYFFFNLKQ